ncbi:MAG: 50S ribosomal protein L25 [Candidatus Colwellbacteria bacterium CG10_big_fil_rev_8_21_14_0_10_42_22]|uniref:Large ribosomal subunit protein bL25 n=1 Tax=Candidatus Colwellbacteria bacterium CG10_big_fil_rev_8_21_14_0_10_42_22 TaxID=1974540 RepID=A0A2H0VGH3_9BACT|nr:MAG: 50S ribosomal protein L25 [Candidatus Colwellbacteria bacterium CG10_big_fil_rev_8_21_14_0_10_42_22]
MTLEIQAQKREILGKKTKTLRKNGLIPAELYGSGAQNEHLQIKEADFSRIYKEAGENTMINLVFGEETRPVLVHEVHINPVTDELLNIDFYQVDLKKKVTTHVPLEYVGESRAVEELGGILNKVLDEVEVEALPSDIPHEIKVDISVLDDFSKSITVADLKVGAKFEILTDDETVVASITEPREEEEELEEELSPEDIEVEGEKKDRDGETKEGEDDDEDKTAKLNA